MQTDDLRTVPAPPAPPAAQRHPRGLATLFFTEMWERFSYYGMRALLVLFMVDATRGGMGLDDRTATAVYGVYTAAVYLLALPGGWLGDRLLGAQRAVWWGGAVIALGHFTLAVPWTQAFYLGLVFVAVGSGVLKPNMSSLVADLYPEGGARRDAGFTIFYMGVNIGAALGPLVCGWLAGRYGWHYGFAAAGVGMILGLVQFRVTRRHLGAAGARRGDAPPGRTARGVLAGGVAAALLLLAAALAGWITLDPVRLAQGMTYVILAVALAFFVGIFTVGGLTDEERRAVVMILVLFLASAVFWAGFEQAGSSFNLFAERHTLRDLPFGHFEVPAAWFQACGATFIILFAPLFASLWLALARRHLDPSVPVKFGLGLLSLAAGFLVMAGAARAAGGGRVWPTWLISTYLLHTVGELCLSPVGLSSVTKLAPKRLTGQMMGVWFLGTALGNLLAGLLAGEFGPGPVEGWAALYAKIAVLPAAAGLVLILASPWLGRWTAAAPASGPGR